MEELIKKLLATDTEVIQKATIELNKALRKPESVLTLFQVLISAQEKEVRQYAAILLKKRYRKKKQWMQLPEQVRLELKSSLLQAIIREPEKSVRISIAHFMGTIVEHELPNNEWPEIFFFIRDLVTDSNIANQELGMFTLATMTGISSKVYLPHVKTILTLMDETLNNYTNLATPVSSHVLQVMLNLAPFIESEEDLVNAYHNMMPRVMLIIHSLTAVDQESAIKGFELLDELCECAAAVITPHVRNLVEMCVSIASNKSLKEELRTKAVIFLGWLTKVKRKAIVKHKLVEPIVDTLFDLMCTKPDDDSREVYFTGEEGNTPITSATQTLDLLALNLPPEKLVPYLMKHMEPALQSDNIYTCKASYLSMAVLAEGCSEYIRARYLQLFLRCICRGITHSELVVRNAALFALGQFSEHLQPDISNYADELLPVLLQHLKEATTLIRQKKDDYPSPDRMFYALEMFAENLEERLRPYLPNLMSIFFEILEDDNSPAHIRELTFSAIAAATNAGKEYMMPYFNKIIGLIQPHLFIDQDNPEKAFLQIQAVDTLGVLARTVGAQNFAPLALKSLELAVNLLKETEDPDLKKSIYGLLASISVVMKNDIALALPVIVEHMIASVKSSDGILTHVKDDDPAIYEDMSGQQDDKDEEDIENTDNEDDDDDIVGYSVENSYIEEKEEAIIALGEIAENAVEAFMPYVEISFHEVFKVMNYPHEDIKKASVDSLMQFTVNLAKISTVEGKLATQKALCLLIPRLSEFIRLEEERDVVIQSLDCLGELLLNIKQDVCVGYGHREAIKNIIVNVMAGEIQCQDQEEGADEELGESEHDELLFEYVGQVLVNFGKAVNADDYADCFRDCFQMMLMRLKSNQSEAQRSYVMGTLAECLPYLKYRLPEFVGSLYPQIFNLLSDPCAEVRSNATFALGELALHGSDNMIANYPQILQTLSMMMRNETSGHARDNIIAAIARLILGNKMSVPVNDVFPVIVNHLPLRDDIEENKTIYKAALVLHYGEDEIFKPHVPILLRKAIDVLQFKGIGHEIKSAVGKFFRAMMKDYSADYMAFYNELSHESQNLLKGCLE